MKTLFPGLAALSLALAACAPAAPSPAEPPATVTITVYFTNIDRYAVGTEPYEDAVTRAIPVPESLPEAVLDQLFLGPTDEERAASLDLVLSGTTGYSDLVIQDGVARVYLTGTCNSGGSTYTIGNLIFANLKQFPEIQWIKIYDEFGETEVPEGGSDSIPFCLEP